MTNLSLPTDSAERKEYPIYSGLVKYFTAALAAVARHSKKGNDKHNPGQEMHHARGKSMDHDDCILRHSFDAAEIKAALDRHEKCGGAATRSDIVDLYIEELTARAWRSLASLQEALERYRDAPMAPGARGPDALPGISGGANPWWLNSVDAAAAAQAPPVAGIIGTFGHGVARGCIATQADLGNMTSPAKPTEPFPYRK